MHAWFRAIQLGDHCRIGNEEYQTVGQVACLQPDGSFWLEWLLVPPGRTPNEAIEDLTARWLAWEEDVGCLLWTPIPLPDRLLPGELPALTRIDHGGRTWQRQERDSFQISHTLGFVGDGNTRGERVEYADFRSGTEKLGFEWNASGLEAFRGYKATPAEMSSWFVRAGVPLNERAYPKPARTAYDDRGYERVQAARKEFWGYVVMVPIVVLMVMLESCGPTCHQRVNPQTGQTEYSCSDGSVRSSRPWFGK